MEETSGNASEIVTYTWGNVGRPRLEISRDDLKELLTTALPVETLAQLCGVSRRTMNRRLKEQSLSVRGCYSSISDNELDHVVRSIKIRMPHAGYRLVKGELLARGHRIQGEGQYATGGWSWNFGQNGSAWFYSSQEATLFLHHCP